MDNFLALKTKCRALLERFWKPKAVVITRHDVPVVGAFCLDRIDERFH